MVLHLLEPVFQPICRPDGSILSYEALLRLPEQQLNIEETIAAWEQSGFIAEVDVAMVSAVKQRLEIANQMPVSLNVSPVTISTAADAYLSAISSLGPEERDVIVEVTERVQLGDLNNLARFVDRCKRAKISLSFDDCHPGHIFSNPLLMRQLRPTFVKIDGRYLHNAFRSGKVDALKSTIRHAKDIGSEIVAEHIDGPEIMAFAVDLGMDYIQGYYSGRPLSSMIAVNDFETREKRTVF